MQTVYFISGLGADERAFSLLDLSFCNPVFVKWIKPGKDETIQSYATRLKAQISDPMPVIVGLSFGGMIGVEIAKLFSYQKLVLLSSAKTQTEIPYYLRFLRILPLHQLVGPSFIKAANNFAYKLMGIDKRADKILFKKMLADADNDFIRWAVHTIIHWSNKVVPSQTIHIHGTKDIILPYRYISADYTIKDGEHLMLLNKPAELSALLKKVILTPQ